MKDSALYEAAQCIDLAREEIYAAYGCLDDANGLRYSDKIGDQFSELMRAVEDLLCRIEMLTLQEPPGEQDIRTE
jgi:hypothetical protein